MQQQLQYYPPPMSAHAPVAMETAQGPHPVLLQNGSGIRRITVRHPMFKIAVWILLLSMVFFLAGFFGPAWHNTEGLWCVCYPYRGCDSNIGRNGPGWLDAVRSLESLSLVALVVSYGFLIYQDVVKSPPSPENKAVELGAAIAGLLNLIGLIIYRDRIKGQNVVALSGTNYPYYQRLYHFTSLYLHWAYWMALTSCVLTLLAASAIAYSRVKHADRIPRATAVSARPSMVGAISQPFPHASQPLPSNSQFDHGMYPSVPTGNQQPSAPLPPPDSQHAQPMMPAASSVMNQTPAPLPVSPSKVPGPPSLPVCYLVNQGHTIPVYDQAPQAPSIVISSPSQ